LFTLLLPYARRAYLRLPTARRYGIIDAAMIRHDAATLFHRYLMLFSLLACFIARKDAMLFCVYSRA